MSSCRSASGLGESLIHLIPLLLLHGEVVASGVHKPGGVLRPPLQLHELAPDLLPLGDLGEQLFVLLEVGLHLRHFLLVTLEQLLIELDRVERDEGVDLVRADRKFQILENSRWMKSVGGGRRQ